MPNAKAICAADSFAQVLNRIEAQKRLSMTYDQDKERSEHQKLTLDGG